MFENIWNILGAKIAKPTYLPKNMANILEEIFIKAFKKYVYVHDSLVISVKHWKIMISTLVYFIVQYFSTLVTCEVGFSSSMSMH
jgi:hypothetical protein